MRMMAVILVFLLFIFSFAYVQKSVKIELLILEQYKENFHDYIIVKDNLEIEYDLKKLSKYFEDNGYSFIGKDGGLKFSVYFDCFFLWEKEYEFYLEKNYENQ